jgi:hypothetical protein
MTKKGPKKAPGPEEGLTKRISVDVDPELHKRIRIDALRRDSTVGEIVRAALLRVWPPEHA